MSIAIYILNIIKKWFSCLVLRPFLCSDLKRRVTRPRRPTGTALWPIWTELIFQCRCAAKKIRIPQDLIKLNPVSPFYYEGFRVYIQILSDGKSRCLACVAGVATETVRTFSCLSCPNSSSNHGANQTVTGGRGEAEQ